MPAPKTLAYLNVSVLVQNRSETGVELRVLLEDTNGRLDGIDGVAASLQNVVARLLEPPEDLGGGARVHITVHDQSGRHWVPSSVSGRKTLAMISRADWRWVVRAACAVSGSRAAMASMMSSCSNINLRSEPSSR